MTDETVESVRCVKIELVAAEAFAAHFVVACEPFFSIPAAEQQYEGRAAEQVAERQ